MFIGKRLAASMASVAMIVAAYIFTSAPASAAMQTVQGPVTCINWLQQRSKPVGIWVDTNTRDGWAVLQPWQGAAGAWTSRMWFDAPDVQEFRLNIGCGGTPQKWGTTVRKTLRPSVWGNPLEARY